MKKGLFVLGTVVLLTGCAAGPSPVGTGLYTNVKGPITATGIAGNQKGEACAQSFLGVINTGDASIEAARKNGQINSISSVDYQTTGAYPIYGKTCTIVSGS